MAFLGFGKKDKVLDLTERYKRKVEKAEKERQAQQDSSATSATGPFSFFDSQQTTSYSSPSESSYPDESQDSGTGTERRKKLAKRIMDMTERLEDLSNQIYHLQQRIEVLEKKNDIRRLE